MKHELYKNSVCGKIDCQNLWHIKHGMNLWLVLQHIITVLVYTFSHPIYYYDVVVAETAEL